MGDNTAIEWCDATWSPLRVRVKQDAAAIATAKGYTSLIQIAEKTAGKVGQHCEKVSEACDNCYAAAFNRRCLPSDGTGLPYDRRSRDLVEPFVDEETLLQPLKWKRPRKIFVENRSDLFGDWYTDEMIDRVFAVMALCAQHTFQVLTKRPERMLKWTQGIDDNEGGWLEGECYRNSLIEGEAQALYERMNPGADPSMWLAVHQPLANVWLGATAENKEWFDKRWEHMRGLAEAGWLLWCSAEPLLGHIDARKALSEGLKWIVTGGESGPGARPSHPAWFRSLRDQCVAAGVAYFHKQNGEYASASAVEGAGKHYHFPDGATVRRVGKKAAGAELDGQTWKQFPGVDA